MYVYLLMAHSLLRWFVLGALLLAVCRGVHGWVVKRAFTRADDFLRHTAATIAHVQLAVGYMLYFNSPFISWFRQHYHQAVKQFDYLFFGMVHISLMTVAVVVITAGSSAAKRKAGDTSKFRIITVCFIAALAIIFIAIPWPFSPLAKRPFIRTF